MLTVRRSLGPPKVPSVAERRSETPAGVGPADDGGAVAGAGGPAAQAEGPVAGDEGLEVVAGAEGAVRAGEDGGDGCVSDLSAGAGGGVADEAGVLVVEDLDVELVGADGPADGRDVGDDVRVGDVDQPGVGAVGEGGGDDDEVGAGLRDQVLVFRGGEQVGVGDVVGQAAEAREGGVGLEAGAAADDDGLTGGVVDGAGGLLADAAEGAHADDLARAEADAVDVDVAAGAEVERVGVGVIARDAAEGVGVIDLRERAEADVGAEDQVEVGRAVEVDGRELRGVGRVDLVAGVTDDVVAGPVVAGGAVGIAVEQRVLRRPAEGGAGQAELVHAGAGDAGLLRERA